MTSYHTIKIFHDGSWNQGTFIMHKRLEVLHGAGQRKLRNGDIEEGTFIYDEFHEGTKTYAIGDVFTGTFQYGCLIQGTKKYADGDVYSGTFELIFKNGTILKSILVKGIQKFLDGTIFEGTCQLVYKNDEIENNFLVKGKFVNKDGEIHSGLFVDGNLVKGIIKCPDGRIMKGEFVSFNRGDDTITQIKKGECTRPGRLVLSGDFIDGKLVRGEKKYQDGRVVIIKQCLV